LFSAPLSIVAAAIQKRNRPAQQSNVCLFTASEGKEPCDDGLMPRLPPPVTGKLLFPDLICLPELPCGEAQGSKCCEDSPACFGLDGFGASLTCVEGFCTRCGLRGTPPCDGAPPPRLRHSSLSLGNPTPEDSPVICCFGTFQPEARSSQFPPLRINTSCCHEAHSVPLYTFKASLCAAYESCFK
jgi:hypothetical protein